jgi:uncharacterized protein VirK/YbjX
MYAPRKAIQGLSVTPNFKDKIEYKPYVYLEINHTYIETNYKGSIKLSALLYHKY